jgi:hypothetical protein
MEMDLNETNECVSPSCRAILEEEKETKQTFCKY